MVNEKRSTCVWGLKKRWMRGKKTKKPRKPLLLIISYVFFQATATEDRLPRVSPHASRVDQEQFPTGGDQLSDNAKQ